MLKNSIKKIFFKIWRVLPLLVRSYLLILPLCTFLPRARKWEQSSDVLPVYVVGFFSAMTGLGSSARLFFKQMQDNGVETYAVDISSIASSLVSADLSKQEFLSEADFLQHQSEGIVIVHVNPPAYMLALWKIRKLLKNKRLVGYWAWELQQLPSFWKQCDSHVNEIFVPSEFVAQAMRSSFSTPIRVHPHAVSSAICIADKKNDQLFVVLLIFDMHSNFYRKNPIAAIQAFKQAFGKATDVLFRIKVGSQDNCLREWRLLREAIGDSSNIEIITQNFTEQEVCRLYAKSNVYLSLHRSEGYGLTIHEAMVHNLDVVATAWSGNMDFMKGPKCYAVPYTLTPVVDPQGTYCISNTVWAEANIETASQFLRQLKEKWQYG